MGDTPPQRPPPRSTAGAGRSGDDSHRAGCQLSSVRGAHSSPRPVVDPDCCEVSARYPVASAPHGTHRGGNRAPLTNPPGTRRTVPNGNALYGREPAPRSSAGPPPHGRPGTEPAGSAWGAHRSGRAGRGRPFPLKTARRSRDDLEPCLFRFAAWGHRNPTEAPAGSQQGSWGLRAACRRGLCCIRNSSPTMRRGDGERRRHPGRADPAAGLAVPAAAHLPASCSASPRSPGTST